MKLTSFPFPKRMRKSLQPYVNAEEMEKLPDDDEE
jgi:hypothetical protein